MRHMGRRRDKPRPVPVRAVVPVRIAYNDVIETDAEVLAWTPAGAGLIRYTPEGERFAVYVWLWANACAGSAMRPSQRVERRAAREPLSCLSTVLRSSSGSSHARIKA